MNNTDSGHQKKTTTRQSNRDEKMLQIFGEFLEKNTNVCLKKAPIPRIRINSLKNLSVSGVWQSFSCSNPCPQSVQKFNQPNHSCGSLSCWTDQETCFKKKNNLQPFQCYQATYLLLTVQMRKLSLREPQNQPFTATPVPTQILYEGTLPLRLDVFTRIGFIWRSCRLKPSSWPFLNPSPACPLSIWHVFFQPGFTGFWWKWRFYQVQRHVQHLRYVMSST